MMKAYIVIERETERYLGRILARDVFNACLDARKYWPKAKKLRVRKIVSRSKIGEEV